MKWTPGMLILADEDMSAFSLKMSKLQTNLDIPLTT